MSADAETLAYWLIKEVNRAVRDHGMIREGDRVAVGVSGGKDGLSLLRLLDLRRRSAPESYDLAAIHVPCDARGAETPPHEPLLRRLSEWGYERDVPAPAIPIGEPLPLGCARCAHIRRHTLFLAAERLGCDVVALGHHADDVAETVLTNLLFHGRVEGMAPARDYFGGRMRIIRPLVYIAEKEIASFARASGFPPPPPVCPSGEESLRAFARRILRETPPRRRDMIRANLLRVGLGAAREESASGELL
ncbi:MAG: hypothetical protein JW958_10595 [Candidatus Eisenbacteria bacterium]|nr:hypothetical protein [Candidatus Eisenbacteria bacterium]